MRRASYLTLTRMLLVTSLCIIYILAQVGIVHAGTLSFGGGATGWTVTITYCTDGISVASSGGAAGAGITSTVLVTGSSIPLATTLPAQAASVVGTGSGTPTISVTATFPYTNTQPAGGSASVTVSRQDNGADIGGSPQTDSGTIGNCTLSAQGQGFSPDDNRVSPNASDRMAIYCNDRGGLIDVWGVGNDSKGFFLTTFSYANIANAGSKGVTHNLGNLGALSIAEISHFTFYLAWNGGPLNANGQGVFAKTFTCAFTTAAASGGPNTNANTTSSSGGASGQPQPSAGTGRFLYVVQPGDRLYRIALRFGTTVAAIAAINGISNPNLIYVGEVLIIP